MIDASAVEVRQRLHSLFVIKPSLIIICLPKREHRLRQKRAKIVFFDSLDLDEGLRSQDRESICVSSYIVIVVGFPPVNLPNRF